jgi:hypothetical protein
MWIKPKRKKSRKTMQFDYTYINNITEFKDYFINLKNIEDFENCCRLYFNILKITDNTPIYTLELKQLFELLQYEQQPLPNTEEESESLKLKITELETKLEIAKEELRLASNPGAGAGAGTGSNIYELRENVRIAETALREAEELLRKITTS